MTLDLDFLERLLDAPGPSGFEVRPARIWRARAEEFADQVSVDVNGNSIAVLNPTGRPRVMLAGHIDEIGLQVTHIDDEGYLYLDEIGGWDPQVLVGQRVLVLGRDGDVEGVIGKKPIHLIKVPERGKATKTRALWVDLGASDRNGVTKLGIRVGDPLVVAAGMVHLAGGRIASRAIDNRIGALVVLEVLRTLATDPPSASVVAVATVQEEIGFMGGGASAGAFSIDPDVALVVDVTFSTDVPDIEKKEVGEGSLGGGPVLSRGSAAHPVVFERLAQTAEREGVSHAVRAAPKSTRTDADGIHLVRGGVPTGLISIPNRYMHSPNEVVDMADVESTVKLMVAFVREMDEETDFTPR